MKATTKRKVLFPALGAAVTALCGIVLWSTPIGEPWVNASYDYLFRFGSRPVTNPVVLVMMDNQAYDDYDQPRVGLWDRGLHARLVDKLADDGCSLVVFDCFFQKPGDPKKDQALAAAIRRQGHTILMARQTLLDGSDPNFAATVPSLPAGIFLEAASNNWGAAYVNPDIDAIVRHHWPFPAPGPYPSLPWAAAVQAGAKLDSTPREQWLRYYGANGRWTRLSYKFAMNEPVNYFRGRIVFIGNEPQTITPESEPDKCQIPYSRWTGNSVGGVEVNITTFLNLLNHEWLERPPGWIEALALIAVGGLLGGFLCRWPRPIVVGLAIAAGLGVALIAICGSYYTNLWFPWLVITGGQVPCALACAFLVSRRRPTESIAATPVPARAPSLPAILESAQAALEKLPDAHDYQLVNPPFGHGAYGKVWLARNAIGQWQALKAVYRANFSESDPFEREFNGIKRYKPVSDKHPGLLRVDYVSMQRDGYFYYVMELGDSLESGWETDPARYKPCDLVTIRSGAPQNRLPIAECLRIGLALTEALDFLHQRGLTHRDIKPQNVIFVNGHPKLADVGLIADIRPDQAERTRVGTPGYMPPEPPGTPQGDIYSLGMVLYVLATGSKSASFPEIATTLAEGSHPADFFALNSVILKACQPEPASRYASAGEMHQALLKVKLELQTKSPPSEPPAEQAPG